MNSEMNLVDNFLAFGTKVAENTSGSVDETYRTVEIRAGFEDFHLRRTSDTRNTVSVDSVKCGSSPSGVSAILESSMDQLKAITAPQNTRTSPQRSTNKNEDFTADQFTIGAIARFHNGNEDNGRSDRSLSDDPNGSGLPRTLLSSMDLTTGGSDYYANRGDVYVKPAGARTVAQSYPHLSQVQGRPSHVASHHQASLQPDRHHQQLASQGPYQRYAQVTPPQHQAQYLPGKRVPPQQAPMGVPQHGYHYSGPSPYPEPHAQAYRLRQEYAPTMPDPYAGYGTPTVPVYGTPRYVKPEQHTQQHLAYPRPPYGGRGMPQHDPYFRGGYAPPPPAPSGYGGYPQHHQQQHHQQQQQQQQQQREDPYYASSGAGTMNSGQGGPGHGGAFKNDGFGPPSYRKCGGGYGGGKGSFMRSTLPAADSVDLNNIDVNTIVYQVQFKKTIRHFTMRPGDSTSVQTGDFVIVQADRGEDLGVITETFSLQAFRECRYAMRTYMDQEDQNIGYILRVASPPETKLLPQKFQDEERILKACENLAINTYRLPLTIVDVEYQFDRHKITVFYDSTVRIDFRDLVRDLFSSFKARVWMKKVSPFQGPGIHHFAAMALATGVQFAGGRD